MIVKNDKIEPEDNETCSTCTFYKYKECNYYNTLRGQGSKRRRKNGSKI